MGQVFRFGVFEADVTRNTLTRNGVRVKIQDQPFRVLIQLMEKPGEVVTREELRQNLWPEGTFVDFDGSLNVILKKLRAAIDDDSDNPRFVETVPRRGYRFIAPVSVPGKPGLENSESSSQTPSAAVPEPTARTTIASRRRRSVFIYVGAVVVLFFVIGLKWRASRREHAIGLPIEANAQVRPPKSIAVLPFSNEGAGADFDYLRYAIANDLVTDLTFARSLSVRPFASTSRYGSQSVDPANVGRDLRVTHVVAGGFLRDKQNLRINLELVDIAKNEPVWRDEFSVSPQDVVALHQQLAARTVQGMLPAMNVLGASLKEVPKPRNEQALSLFLHSLSIAYDPGPNRIGIKKLEESVAVDSSYAPAWQS